MFNRIWFAIAAVGLLGTGGCNAIPGYAEYNAAARALALEAVQEYKQFHDDERAALLAALCNTTVGSVSRESDWAARQFILSHCGVTALPASMTGGPGSAVTMSP